MNLKESLIEAWSDTVKVKIHSPVGLFANGSAKEIEKWLVDNHDNKGAIDSLNFYINRAGNSLSNERKEVLDSVLSNLTSKSE